MYLEMVTYRKEIDRQENIRVQKNKAMECGQGNGSPDIFLERMSDLMQCFEHV